ncbi:MAG: lamin tail domain-containing protein [Bacteroidota bacterium]|nr:lamin tail domain-containing protein [Bacteroidota bacterium]
MLQAQTIVAVRFDVVIDEILADPTPVVGLPNAEFIEVRNTSGRSINLQGWKCKSTTSSSSAFPLYILPADSFLIITSAGNSHLFTSFGRVMGISSFPALNNAGTTLSLISKEGKTIHSVSYNNKWFQNDVKSNGGWSLEMIDTRNPCAGFDNWKASIDPKGGTPGTNNSIDAINPDKIAPALLRAFAIDSLNIILTFSETVDSAKAAVAANFSVSDGVGFAASATVIPPTFTNISLRLNAPLTKGKIYTVTATNVEDCSGNVIQAANKTRVGVASTIDTFEIVINEILFNPKPTGADYVEIYNRSNKIFNLKDIYIANRSLTTNTLASLRQLTANNILFFPGDFFVISGNGDIIKQNYIAKNPDNFINVSMPSLPDNEGVFVLLNAQGKIADELHYSAKWHFALIDNKEGVALERIDYNKPTQNKDNWTSAASTVGYGTPSYQNSQFRTDIGMPGEVTITPKTFSPDNDGFEDYTIINIKLSDPGYVANITIFDAFGKPVRDLAKNATLASSATFRWDGLNDRLQKVPIGVYIVFTEVFNLNGKKKSFKNTVVVAARF